MKRIVFLLTWVVAAARAEIPAAVSSGIDYLREHASYSWETINSDPGPVEISVETPRGTVNAVQQNNSPHILGSIDVHGDILLQRDWADGLKLKTLITTDGAIVTETPEGWMTNQEILTALAQERLSENGPSSRYMWLRRADRPEVRQPDQELGSLLKLPIDFEQPETDTFVAVLRPDHPEEENSSQPRLQVQFTLHLRTGVIRDYDVQITGSRPMGRARVQVPVNERRTVIITYLPVRKLDVPDEARDKLKTNKSLR